MSSDFNKEYIKQVVSVCFRNNDLIEKHRDFRSGLRQIFSKQGELVLYPNNDVTCFKYKNEVYYNPNYPKLADNKIQVNLRHLHPSLHREMDNLIKITAEIDVAEKRFESYCNRASKHLTQEAYDLLDSVPVQDWSIIFFGFLIKCLPKTLLDKHKYYLEEQFDHLRVVKTMLTKPFMDDLMTRLEVHASNFKEKEKTCVNQIDTFMFTVDVLGF